MTGTPRERLEQALAAPADSAATIAGTSVTAIGWATVDLDRAAIDLAGALGLAVGAFAPAARSEALGGACLVARGVLAGGRSIVLIEPDTEGRLAATLARRGEGPAVAWLVAPGMSAALTAIRAADIALSSARDGPFGPERLLNDGAVDGPHRLLVGHPAGTIHP